MLFLASSMRENVWKKDRSSQVQIRINLPQLFTWSSLQIFIDLKGFTCHWRFVTRSQQLCSKSFLLPDIKLSSFSLSRPLLQYFNRQSSKRNNLAKGRVANVSLGVLGRHVTYAKCPSLGITVVINIFFIFFLATKIFLWRSFYG